ncbi:MAG: hypothetical protein IKZ16_08810, partial [Clostridia bacterium]|nr:hypothetical protein [Clostridia bacterium]
MAKKVIDKFVDLAGENVDPRTRRYLVPKRLVWTQGNVTGAEHLLDEKSNQITLVVGKDNCTLKNEPGKPHAAILVDFGIEFAGSARFHTWMTKGPGHNGAVKVAVRFGESVMEALTPLGEKNTTNDHAIRDSVYSLGMYSGVETNETGYRFLYVELLDDDAFITFKAIQGVFHYMDLEYKGTFRCSDDRLNQIWDTAAYTAHLNMQEYLW